MGKFRDCLRFISLIHSTWRDDIPYEILFPVNCILHIWLYFFHMGVVLDTGIWGLWSKNEPSEISKNDQKRISSDSVSNKHWRSKHVKYN